MQPPVWVTRVGHQIYVNQRYRADGLWARAVGHAPNGLGPRALARLGPWALTHLGLWALAHAGFGPKNLGLFSRICKNA